MLANHRELCRRIDDDVRQKKKQRPIMIMVAITYIDRAPMLRTPGGGAGAGFRAHRGGLSR